MFTIVSVIKWSYTKLVYSRVMLYLQISSRITSSLFQMVQNKKSPHKKEHVILAAMICGADDWEECRHKSPGPGDAEASRGSNYVAYVFAFVGSVRCN